MDNPEDQINLDQLDPVSFIGALSHRRDGDHRIFLKYVPLTLETFDIIFKDLFEFTNLGSGIARIGSIFSYKNVILKHVNTLIEQTLDMCPISCFVQDETIVLSVHNSLPMASFQINLAMNDRHEVMTCFDPQNILDHIASTYSEGSFFENAITSLVKQSINLSRKLVTFRFSLEHDSVRRENGEDTPFLYGAIRYIANTSGDDTINPIVMKSVDLYRNADVGDEGVSNIEAAIDAKMMREKMRQRNQYIDQMIEELNAIKSRGITMTGNGYKRKKKSKRSSKRSSRYRKSSRRKRATQKRVTQKRKVSRQSKKKRSKGKRK